MLSDCSKHSGNVDHLVLLVQQLDLLMSKQQNNSKKQHLQEATAVMLQCKASSPVSGQEIIHTYSP